MKQVQARFLPSFESFLFGFLWNHFIFNSISNYFHLKLIFLKGSILDGKTLKEKVSISLSQ